MSSRSRCVRAAIALAMLATAAACSSSDDDREPASDWSPAPVRIDGTRVLAQSDADGFRLHTESGDKTFLPGVNLGSSTPLHQPGEVGGIEPEHLERWVREIGESGARVVRVYTLLPPAFYDALASYNNAHPRSPLYLAQGVYLPDESYFEPGRTLYSPQVDGAFREEIADIQAALRGDLTRSEKPGHATGTWRTDVTQWLAAWIIGVEWDPYGVRQTDRAMAKAAYRPGTYFAATEDATATERWIAGHMDELASAEAKSGRSLPIAFANWPTTDPLTHPTEPLRSEDLVGVDANHVLPTAKWPGGTFASFHAYPYYPDFQRYQAGYEQTSWRGKQDRYAGYLTALKEHFADRMPLLVSEFGVPSSLGSAHVGTEDHEGRTRDQGGHTEQQAMGMNAEMMRMMEHQGISGAFVFAWTDEWFKRTWNTMEHQEAERRQLWHDPLTNEQWFGLVATDPEPVVDAAAEVVNDEGEPKYIYVRADASWVHIDVTGADKAPRRLTLEADVVPGPDRADYRVVVDRDAGTAQLFVRRDLDPIRLDTQDRPYRPDQDEPWHLFQLIVNRAYSKPVARPAEYQDVGNLIAGTWDPESDDYDSRATWRIDDDHDTVKLRIPWSMLGMADPSSRTALGEGTPARMVKIDAIRFRVAAENFTESIDFAWPTWNHTGYRERHKAGLGEVERAMRELAP